MGYRYASGGHPLDKSKAKSTEALTRRKFQKSVNGC